MDFAEMDQALRAMTGAAREAGKLALDYFRRGVEVTFKPDRSPVTRADREAELVIVEVLGKAFPGARLPGRGAGCPGVEGAPLDHRSH